MTERVWSRQDIEDRVNVLRERFDGEAFADAVAEFSKELEPEEQEDLREILLERSREHAARNPNAMFSNTLISVNRAPN